MEQLDRDKLVLGHSTCLGPSGLGIWKYQEVSGFGAEFGLSTLIRQCCFLALSPQASIYPIQTL